MKIEFKLVLSFLVLFSVIQQPLFSERRDQDFILPRADQAVFEAGNTRRRVELDALRAYVDQLDRDARQRELDRRPIFNDEFYEIARIVSERFRRGLLDSDDSDWGNDSDDSDWDEVSGVDDDDEFYDSIYSDSDSD